MSECQLCSMKPVFDAEGCWLRFESSTNLEYGPWISLMACKDQLDRMAIYAVADDYSDMYYPNFCPKCGRRLKEEAT